MITTADLSIKGTFKSQSGKMFAFVYTALIANLENPGSEHTEFPCPCCHGRAWIDKPAGSLKHFRAECRDCGMEVVE